MKITGSKTVSEIVREFCPNGGKFRVEISGDATTVSGSEARPTVRVAASDFFLALAGAGAVGEALLARAMRAAADRAGGKELPEADREAADRLKERAEAMGDEFAAALPPVVRPGTVRVTGKAVDKSGIAEHGISIAKPDLEVTFAGGRVTEARTLA
jgi:hypothetical protein